MQVDGRGWSRCVLSRMLEQRKHCTAQAMCQAPALVPMPVDSATLCRMTTMNAVNGTLEQALALLRQGQHARAEHICRSIIHAAPDDFGACHLLGVILLQRGQPASAEKMIGRAIDINPGVAGAYYNHGNALLASGHPGEAIASYDHALRLKPDMVEALYNRGNAQAAHGQPEAAVASYRAVLAINPRMVGAHNALGGTLFQLKRNDEALTSLDAALALDASHAGALNNRGNTLFALARYKQALASYDQAIAAMPSAAEPHDNRGLTLQELGRCEEAIDSHTAAISRNPRFGIAYIRRALARRQLGLFKEALQDADEAIRLDPGSAKAFDCRGVVLNDMGRYDEALLDYRKAVALDPGFAQAHNNMGNVLYDLGRMDDALASLQRAIDLRPAFPEAHSNRGLVLQDTRQFAAALEAYGQAIASRPAYAEAYKRRATLQLLQGDYKNGWADYETSFHQARQRNPGPLHDIAPWQGQSLQGKSIVLSERSGLGDTIQFWRFMPVLLAMGAQVSFLGSERMFRLLRSSPWPVRLLSSRPPGEVFDYRCELWSLPHQLDIELHDIPHDVPYLRAEEEAAARWASLLPKDRFNIGISWQGNPARKIDAGRSIPLRAFRPLAEVPGVQLVSLQKNDGLEQLQQLPAGMSVVDPGPAFDAGADAFIDTAGMMAGLDLVISSDTAVVHLAGALARPTWVGLKWMPEWRWLLDRSDSPWYPTLQLFRQATPGDWDGVFEAMAKQLHTAMG